MSLDQSHGKTAYLRAWLRSLDARIRRNFCFSCDRPTILQHRCQHAFDNEVRRLLEQEWRR